MLKRHRSSCRKAAITDVTLSISLRSPILVDVAALETTSATRDSRSKGDKNLSNQARKTLFVAMLACVVSMSASLASAQALNSGAQPIALNAQLSESLTVSLSANAVNFTLAAGSNSNPGSGNVTATTAWVLKPGRTKVTVDAYFVSAAAALTDGAGNNIPSSAFTISDNAAAAAPLVNTVAFGAANAGLRLASVAITGANKSANRTDVMAFNIDLSAGALPQLPAATYTGTLNIQAQATP